MLQFLFNGLCKGSIYSLVALGFGLIYSAAGVFHIAHGLIYTAAAYMFFWIGFQLGAPLSVAALAALIGAAALAVLIEMLVYRPLDRRKASSAVVMVSSFGVYIVGVNLLAMLFGAESRILSSETEAMYRLGTVLLTRIQIMQMAAGLIGLLVYWLFLRWSALGRVCRAVADDSMLASVLGVRVQVTRSLVFAIGSVLAATGAVLTALDVGMDPFGGLPMMLVASVACIAGGLHRFLAPALGGLLLGVLQSFAVLGASGRWENGVTFAVLILFMLFRPQGLLGRAARLEETT